MATSSAPESKSSAEALIPQFQFTRILNQDQSGRRITLLGTISSQQALLVLERSAFPSSPASITSLLTRLTSTTNLGANDIYRWYMSDLSPPSSSDTSTSEYYDLKLNLIYPCTASHIRKYSQQTFHYVLETPVIYAQYIRPYIVSQREQGRLDWIFNILDGRTEQEDVILRSGWDDADQSGFLLLPDLNWDRSTLTSLHLLALVQRRDIFSIRDLKKKHVAWLRGLREHVIEAVTKKYGIEADEIKLYCHYHPTYYHFHIHVVHAMLEPEGGTQSVGKAWGLDMLLEWLTSLSDGEEKGMNEVALGYTVGERNDLWEGLWAPLKDGKTVTLNNGKTD